jgi:hypothetical protein
MDAASLRISNSNAKLVKVRVFRYSSLENRGLIFSEPDSVPDNQTSEEEKERFFRSSNDHFRVTL